jgi:hypothetical protein
MKIFSGTGSSVVAYRIQMPPISISSSEFSYEDFERHWKFCGGVSHTIAAYLSISSIAFSYEDFELHWKFCGGVSHTKAAYLYFLK